MPPAASAGLSGANLAATKEVKSPLHFRLGRPCATAVRFRVLLQLYEGAEDTGTTFDPPWPDLFRLPTSSNKALSAAGKAWMAGTSPAMGISGCIVRIANNRFRSTGQAGQCWRE